MKPQHQSRICPTAMRTSMSLVLAKVKNAPDVVHRIIEIIRKKLNDAKAAIQAMLDLNYIRPPKSPYASPLHMHHKPSGDRVVITEN